MLHENTKKMRADYFEKTGITQKTFEKICYFCITRRKDRLIKKYDEKINVKIICTVFIHGQEMSKK